MNLTEQQRAAIESAGKTIVSASAGSGKTFVMIRKLVAAIESGGADERQASFGFDREFGESGRR